MSCISLHSPYSPTINTTVILNLTIYSVKTFGSIWLTSACHLRHLRHRRDNYSLLCTPTGYLGFVAHHLVHNTSIPVLYQKVYH